MDEAVKVIINSFIKEQRMSQVDTGECDASLAVSEEKEVVFRWCLMHVVLVGEVLALIRVTMWCQTPSKK